MRNYGIDFEVETFKNLLEGAPLLDIKLDFSSPTNSPRGMGDGSHSRKKQHQPMSISEVKLAYGFLKRLEVDGQNVQIGSEINDVLFLEERSKAVKERLEEEHKKKAKKPRPRDVVDFEHVKQINRAKERDLR